MNATTVFEDRRDEFYNRIASAPDAQARMDAAVFVVEQIACVLAQEETDSIMRQRQQAVLALVKSSPSLLIAAQAKGELCFGAKKQTAGGGRLRLSARTVGAGILALLAAYELIDGQLIFAALQAAGCSLLLLGAGPLGSLAVKAGYGEVRGVIEIEPKALLERIGQLCRAADVCVGDLVLIEREAGLSRLSGTADDAMLDLLTAMLEARASDRADAAERTLDLAQQYLSMLDITPVYFSAQNAEYFDVLPTLSGERTVRPALMRDGSLIRRGLAVRAMERSVGA